MHCRLCLLFAITGKIFEYRCLIARLRRHIAMPTLRISRSFRRNICCCLSRERPLWRDPKLGGNEPMKIECIDGKPMAHEPEKSDGND